MPLDTRERIVRAAFRLFRKHGYAGVGLADLLAEAGAPKGLLYHHFPQGKEAVAVAVVERIADDVSRAFSRRNSGSKPSASCAALLADGGTQLVQMMQKTNHELCALFSAFVTERHRSPLLGAAIEAAYSRMIIQLAGELRAEGWGKSAARTRALLIVSVLEGGALLSQAQGDAKAFRLALKHAQTLCTSAAT
jgi:TetR/AcrR family transcriptional regulator, lmrAB and yxaGH operons repressor